MIGTRNWEIGIVGKDAAKLTIFRTVSEGDMKKRSTRVRSTAEENIKQLVAAHRYLGLGRGGLNKPGG